MPSHPRRRKVLLWTGGFFFFLILLILTSPLWIPWILKPMAHRFGADFNSFERLGLEKLALDQVSFNRDGITFQAGRVEILQPLSWLWRQSAGDATTERVAVSNWQLSLQGGTTKKPKQSAVSLFNTVQRISPQLQDWIPIATLKEGLIRAGTNEMHISKATWRNGVLRGDVIAPRFNETVAYDLDMSKTNQLTLHATVPEMEIASTLHAEKRSGLLNVSGDIFWRTNRLGVSAQFGSEGVLPRAARIESGLLWIPGREVRLTNYHDLKCSFVADWNGTNFFVNLTGNADPLTNSLPPLQAVIRARGNTNAVLIETFKVTSPRGNAELSKNVEVSTKGILLSETAAFTVLANLSDQHFVRAAGVLSGQVFLHGNGTRYPDATFKLTADDLATGKYESKRVEAEGGFSWPEVNFRHLLVRVAEGAELTGHGLVDLQEQYVRTAEIELKGILPSTLLPTNTLLGSILLNAKLSGPFEDIAHEGHVKFSKLVVPKLNPLRISAEWKGRQLDFENIEATLAASNMVAKVSGSAAIGTNESVFNLQSLLLTTNKISALELIQPAQITASRKAPGQRWNFSATPVQFRGAAGEISFSGNAVWPTQGTLVAAVGPFRTTFFQDLTTNKIPEVFFRSFRLSGGWTNSALAFSVIGRAAYNPPQDFPLEAEINAAGDKSGLRFEDLSVWRGSNKILAATGTLPLRVWPARGKGALELQTNEPIQFRASTKPNETFWNSVTKLAKLKLDRPEITLTLSGSLNQPIAEIVGRADGVEWLGGTRRIPRVTNLRMSIGADRKKLQLRDLKFKVEGQPVFVSAEMPIGDVSKQWKEMFDWRKANGRVVMENAQVAPFLPFAPAVLGPSGSVDLNVTFSSGARVNGDLKLRNIETRPLGTIGALHDLQAHLKFTESLLQFTNVNGVLGGETVGLSGFINFAETAPNQLPLFDLNVAGKNVPLSRQPDLILRADIELNALNTRTNDQPVVSGLVDCKDSFFLGDIKMLLPGRVARPRERPPYFSVEAEPFASWRVNVHLTGDKFLRVRTPLFRGAVSANFRVRGTLREPMALGDAKIESGQVQFPFSNLNVQQGFVTLTSEDPFRPHIFATASSRTFGYDVQMTLNGPVDKPIVEFSSTPPLTSEQVLLMMTAGELPRREATFSAQQRAGRLALFLGKTIFSKLAPGDGGAERLTITSGENVTEQGKQTYAIEYKVTDDVSVVGEYDRFGAWNVGVKWRVYAK
jgi:translocation and assembly module TamB